MTKPGASTAAAAHELDTEPAPPEMEAGSGATHVGTLLADRYRVDKLLGEGGMGQVFLGEHVHMRKAVAIKVLHRELTMQPEIVARFEREAVAAGRIEHPHVAAATDFGRLPDGAFYLVLEFVEGESLTALLSEQVKLPARRALGIARQIADALQAAHAAGVIHRDLKPDNVMLVNRPDGEDFVKVLDFGIAKVQGEDVEQPALTRAGTVFGTPEYMAPEQAQGLSADGRADLYTLGMMLYEMLSGCTAFKDDDLLVVLTRQMTAAPPSLPPEVDSKTSELVMTLLRKNPEERVSSAGELIARIDEILGDPSSLASEAVSGASWSAPGVHSIERSAGRQRPLVGALLSHAGALGARLPELKAELRRSVAVRGLEVPLWSFLAVGTLVVFVLALMLSGGGAERPGSAADAPSQTGAARGDDAVVRQQLIERARRGEREALSELQKLAARRKDTEAWLALGRGYAAIHYPQASLAAYSTAVGLQPERVPSRELLVDVRAAAEEPGQLEAALNLAERLGAPGADIIYDVWASHKADTGPTSAGVVARARLAKDEFVSRASPALSVALELGKAKRCVDLKRLMPRAAESADARSARKLAALTHRSGCGFLGLRDCYGCLRGDDNFSRALARARSTPAPDVAPTAQASAAPRETQGRSKSSLSRAGRQ